METPVGSLKCPNCGGAAATGSVICSWCGSTLFTVACPHCFASLFVGMKHCPSCGAEAIRDPASQSSPSKCPRCAIPLLLVKVGETDLSECRRCGGLWVDKASFEKICEEREEQEAVLGQGTSAPAPANAAGVSNGRLYVPCPRCGNLMNRINFAGCSGVVIDWCKDHGSWFDHQELREIVLFIQAGGLKKSRERELQRIREETRRLKEQERELITARLREGGSVVLGTEWKQDPGLLADILTSIWKGMPKA